MEAFLAHSSRDGCPPQTYEAHIRGVYAKASAYVAGVEQYTAKAKDILTEIVQKSALMHDLGKLDDENQNVLHSSDRGKRHLPINHVDAGSAALKSQDSLYAALMVYSHHRGLPDLETESLREEAIFRDEHAEVRKRTDETLDELLRRHEMIFRSQAVKETQPYDGDQNVLFRMALSCIPERKQCELQSALSHDGKTIVPYYFAKKKKEKAKVRFDEKCSTAEKLGLIHKYVNERGEEIDLPAEIKEIYSYRNGIHILAEQRKGITYELDLSKRAYRRMRPFIDQIKERLMADGKLSS